MNHSKNIFFSLMLALNIFGIGCDPEKFDCNVLKESRSFWNKSNDPEAAVRCLQSFPVNDIKANTIVADYLSKHKVLVSLTTSPKRLKDIGYTLETIDTTHVHAIILALPERYSRNQESYNDEEINALKNKFGPIIQVLRPAIDEGPITKLLPAARYALEVIKDKDTIIITLDDDTVYPKGMINQLITTVISENAVVTGKGHNIESDDIDTTLALITRDRWPEKDIQKPLLNSQSISACDFILGYSGVAYVAKFVDITKMKEYSQLDQSCFNGDDLVISYVLAENKVRRVQLRDYYFHLVVQLPSGFGADALVNLQGEATHQQNYFKCTQLLSNR